MKRNRDVLNQICMYDLLCRMQKELERCSIELINDACIMDVLGFNVTSVHYRHMKHNGDCSECIQSFLNEEYDRRW